MQEVTSKKKKSRNRPRGQQRRWRIWHTWRLLPAHLFTELTRDEWLLCLKQGQPPISEVSAGDWDAHLNAGNLVQPDQLRMADDRVALVASGLFCRVDKLSGRLIFEDAALAAEQQQISVPKGAPSIWPALERNLMYTGRMSAEAADEHKLHLRAKLILDDRPWVYTEVM